MFCRFLWVNSFEGGKNETFGCRRFADERHFHPPEDVELLRRELNFAPPDAELFYFLSRNNKKVGKVSEGKPSFIFRTCVCYGTRMKGER